MNRSRLILTVLGGLLLGAGLFSGWRCAGDQAQARDRYAEFQCAQKHLFTLTKQQISDHHQTRFGEPIPCPTCGDLQSTRLIRHPETGQLLVQDRDPVQSAP